MFDIGFFELLLISVVGLLVFGPEQFLDAVKTTLHWVKKIRRSFDDVRMEVQRELHNDEVMKQLKDSASDLEQEIREVAAPVSEKLESIEREARTAVENHDSTPEPATNPTPSRVEPS